MVEAVRTHPVEDFIHLSPEEHKAAQGEANKVWMLANKILGEGHPVRVPSHPDYLEMQLIGQDQIKPENRKIMDFNIRLTTMDICDDPDAPLPSDTYLFLRINGGTVVKETRRSDTEKINRQEVGKEELGRLLSIVKNSRSLDQGMVL